jgi:GNAT superfamily N-acetyltransferase
MNNFSLNDIKIQEIDFTTFSKEDWRIFHEYRRKRHEETDPDDPLVSDDIAERTYIIKVNHPMFKIHPFKVIDINNPNSLIGIYYYGIIRESNPSYDDNKHIGRFHIELLPEYRQKGIGTMILKELVKEAEKKQLVILITDVFEDSGKVFLKSIGAKNALANVENRLYLKETPWKLVNEWNNIGAKIDSQIEFFFTVPEDIIEDYAKIFTEVENQAPIDDLEFKGMIFSKELLREREENEKKKGNIMLTAITKEDNGDISGLTEVTYNPHKSTLIYQSLTGVKDKYRGKGLGKWLKAAMLLRIREDFPEVKIVITGNANSNAPMLSINDRLGFKVHKERMSSQISTEEVQKYLKKFD